MLDRKSKNILILCGLFLLVLLITEVARPKPINWKPNYTATSKDPFGSFIIYEELKNLYKEETLSKKEEDPFTYLLKDTLTKNATYLFINDNIYFDEQQTNGLLEFASRGNTVFVSAHRFGGNLNDTLKLDTYTQYNLLDEEEIPQFFNSEFSQDTLPKFQKWVRKTVFTEIDTLKTEAIGHFKFKEDENIISAIIEDSDELTSSEDENYIYSKMDQINMIRYPLGDGQIILHTLPETFTNYYMLHGGDDYASKVLSYINTTDKIYWDAYEKSGRKIVTSSMRFVFNQAPLKWAYYLLMGGLLLFIIFRGKREQRIIEVLEPLQNTSIAFTKTIGSLYFQNKDYSDLIAKKITFFLEQIRSEYYMDTTDLNDVFIKNLSLKSGQNIENTKKIIGLIQDLKGKIYHSEQDLIELNKLMTTFNKK